MRSVTSFLKAAAASVAASSSYSVTLSSQEKQKTKEWYFYRGKMSAERAQALNLYSCQENPIATDIATYLGTSLRNISLGTFADGESAIDLRETVRGKRIYVICSTTSASRILELLLTISAMKRSSAKKIIAVIPFYGYGRQDQTLTLDTSSTTTSSIAAADVARMLTVVEVDHIVTMDLHSACIEGFFPSTVPVDNLKAAPVGAMFFKNLLSPDAPPPIVIAPHASKVSMALVFRKYLRDNDELPGFGMVIKSHVIDVAGQAKKPAEIVGQDVTGRDCIIVDSLVDTATTLIETATLLKNAGAKTVSAFCVHGRFSNDALNRIQKCSALSKLVVTDTIPQLSTSEVDKITVLTVAPIIAQVIANLEMKKSVSSVCHLK